MTIEGCLGKLANRESLTRAEAKSVMDQLFAGEAGEAQIGAFLMGLRSKGETVDEITGLVESMRAASVRVSPNRAGLVDLCGTGGDGSGTFNISTAAAIVVAGAGVPVAKHGNRSASSLCGSADVLEALGVTIGLEPDVVTKSIEDIGFGFLFAPKHHPAMRHVGPSRAQLKMRTVFNILGPMTNPASVKRQMIGVFDPDVRETMGSVLRTLGSEAVWCLHGEGGLDEASIEGATHVFAFDEFGERNFELTPESVGLTSAPLSSLAGGDAAKNAEIIESIFAGEAGPRRDAVVLNAAVALAVQGKVAEVADGVPVAQESLDSGAAKKVLEELRKIG